MISARILRALAAGLLGLGAAGLLAAEDLTIVSTVTFGNREMPSTHYITSEASKTSSRDSDSIVRFSDGRVTLVDHRNKEYWEATADEMEEQWERMARKMRTSGAGDIFDLRAEPKLEKLKGSRKVAGYDCEHWSLQVGDALEVDFWAAPGLRPPPRYYDGRRVAAFSMGPMGVLFEKMYEGMKQVKGFPLSSAIIIRTPISRSESLDEASEVKKGPIPASTFDVPAGYKKVKSPFERER